MSARRGLLGHVRVAHLGSIGPGARAARILADFGADVVRVEPPRASRRGGGHDVPYHAYSAGRGTRRLRVDLAHPLGREAFLRLASMTDVVIASFRPTTAESLGVDHESVRARNPRVVYCSISGYGESGPYAAWAGHDIDYLAVSGMAAAGQPRADGGPAVPGATVADAAGGGMHAALSVLAALAHRSETGEGMRLDCAAIDGMLWIMSVALEEHLALGSSPGAGEGLLTGRYAWYDFYRAADGRWLAVGAIEPRFFANLCDALGLGHLASRQYDADQGALRAELARAFATRPRDEWVAELGPHDTCVAPVNTVAEALEDPQVAERLPVLTVEHAEHGTFRQVGPLLGGTAAAVEPVRVAASDDTDTDDILTAAGVAAGEIDELRRSGVIE